MNQNINRDNQAGFAHLLLLLMVIVVLIGGVGTYVFTERKQQNDQRQEAARNALADEAKEADTTTASEAEIKPTEVPASTPTPSSTTSSPKPTTTTTTSTNQTTTVTASVTISDDGCYVTAKGSAGSTFTVGAYKTNKGGQQTYTLPASGTLTKASGGYKDMTAFGEITLNGSKGGRAEKLITADSCPAS